MDHLEHGVGPLVAVPGVEVLLHGAGHDADEAVGLQRLGQQLRQEGQDVGNPVDAREARPVGLRPHAEVGALEAHHVEGLGQPVDAEGRLEGGFPGAGGAGGEGGGQGGGQQGVSGAIHSRSPRGAKTVNSGIVPPSTSMPTPKESKPYSSEPGAGCSQVDPSFHTADGGCSPVSE